MRSHAVAWRGVAVAGALLAAARGAMLALETAGDESSGPLFGLGLVLTAVAILAAVGLRRPVVAAALAVAAAIELIAYTEPSPSLPAAAIAAPLALVLAVASVLALREGWITRGSQTKARHGDSYARWAVAAGAVVILAGALETLFAQVGAALSEDPAYNDVIVALFYFGLAIVAAGFSILVSITASVPAVTAAVELLTVLVLGAVVVVSAVLGPEGVDFLELAVVLVVGTLLVHAARRALRDARG